MQPLRKDEVSNPENISTADIAREPVRGPQLVENERAENERNVEEGEIRQGEAGEGRKMGEQGRRVQLFPDNELADMRARWDKVQTGFVDEPREAVKQADGLVASAVKRIAEGFAQERAQLEQQWDRGDSVNTEDLRQALRRYRSFFDRLLSV